MRYFKKINESFTRDVILAEAKQDEQRLVAFAGEDLAKRFMSLRQKLKSPENDIYYWLKKTPEEFKSFIVSKEGEKSKSQVRKEIKDDGYELVASNNEFDVYLVKTQKASCLLGAGTKWCISAKINNSFEHYNENADIYFLISKDNKKTSDKKYALLVKEGKSFNHQRSLDITNYVLYDEKDRDITETHNIKIPEIPGVKLIHEHRDELFSNDGKRLIRVKGGIIKYTIPNSVTHIGVMAFYQNKLTSITIPNSVTYIDDYAFYQNQLTSVTIPNSVTHIGRQAFAYNQITSVTIPNSVTHIDDWAFAYNKLKSVYISNSVTHIGYGAFSFNQLTSVTIPNSVTHIEDGAFSDNQLTSVTIPNSVTHIEDGAFEWNKKLKTIYVEHPSKPKNWENDWAPKNAKIIWGYKSKKIKEDVEGGEIDIQPVSKEEVLKNVLEKVKEKFEESGDFFGGNDNVMLLPDGTRLLANQERVKDEDDYDDDDEEDTYVSYDIENFDLFLNDYIKESFIDFTGSIHIYDGDPDGGEMGFEIHLSTKRPTQKQYSELKKGLTEYINFTSSDEHTFTIFKPKSNYTKEVKTENPDKIITIIKNFYSMGSLKENTVQKIKRGVATGKLVENLKEENSFNNKVESDVTNDIEKQITFLNKINENVKLELDSQGNELSQEQVDFFRNSQVRDKNGKLLILYHGTQKSFDTFRYLRKNNNNKLNFGKAFYFTDDLDIAKDYSEGKLLMNCYLNLKNPLIVDAKGMGVKSTQYDKIHTSEMKKYIEDNNMNSLSYPYEVYFHQAKKEKRDGIIVYNIIDNHYGSTENVRPTNVYISFNENQIKSINNKTPTNSNNVNEYVEEDIGDEEVDLQPMSKEEVLKDALKRAKEYFYTLRPIESHSKEFMVLPDGTQLSSMTTEEAPDIGGPQYDTSGEEKYNHIVEYFNSIFEDFMNITESVAVVPVSGLNERRPFLIYLNSKGITEAQYRIIQMSVKPKVENNRDMDLYFRVYKPNKEFINFTRKRGEDSKAFTDKIINMIKSFYGTGTLKEDINHREVYKSLTFSDTPKLGPIFISRDGEFVNVNPEGAHSEIFGDEDYEADDYYTLHDAFGLIKANSGNKIEPFAYIDIWVIPNPAQKKAIIDWMYFLIENGRKNILINTPWMSKTGDFSSDSNKTYSLESNIPEDIYGDVVRSL